jgi:hypothetical protein
LSHLPVLRILPRAKRGVIGDPEIGVLPTAIKAEAQTAKGVPAAANRCVYRPVGKRGKIEQVKP